MDEAMVGVDQGVKTEINRSERLVLGAKELRDDGYPDFLIPTVEDSKTLRKMVEELIRLGEGKGVTDFLKAASEIVFKELPYANIESDKGLGDQGVSADIFRNLDNLKYAIDSGFSTGVVCRQQAPVLFGLLREFEHNPEIRNKGPFATEDGKSRFVLMYFAYKEEGAHMVVYDHVDKLIIDPTNNGVVRLTDIDKAYSLGVDKSTMIVLQPTSSETKAVTFKKFFSSPSTYIN